MGYRIILALFSVAVIFSGCAAFDTDNTPYTGFSPDLIPNLPGQAGPYTGYYVGTMKADTNNCEAVSDKVGDAVPVTADVVQSEQLVSLKFGDSATSGELSKDGKSVFMLKSGNTEHVYYLSFADNSKISGTCEAIEADANGEFKSACATYTVTLEKGEKPAGN